MLSNALRALSPVKVGRRRILRSDRAPETELLSHSADEPSGLGVPQRPEQHAVQHAEDRRVDANRQPQRQDDDDGESRVGDEEASGLADVVFHAQRNRITRGQTGRTKVHDLRGRQTCDGSNMEL